MEQKFEDEIQETNVEITRLETKVEHGRVKHPNFVMSPLARVYALFLEEQFLYNLHEFIMNFLIL